MMCILFWFNVCATIKVCSFSTASVEKISELGDFAFNDIVPTTSIIQNLFSEHVLLHLHIIYLQQRWNLAA